MTDLESLRAEVARLTAERDALRVDAERYRWLRADRKTTLIVSFFGNGCINRTIEEVDAVIDAARAAKGTK